MGNLIITFDCYGTLIDWEAGIVNAFQTAAAADQIELSADQIIDAYEAEEATVEAMAYRPYREVLRDTERRAAAILGWQVPAESAGFLADSLPSWKPFPDTNDALERLSRRFKLGILSNIDDDLLTATRHHFSVDFDLIVTAQQVSSYKPGLAHFKEAKLRMGDTPLLHAAQSYFHDVVPATQMSIPVVWVNRKNKQTNPGGPSPTHQVRDLTELANYLGV
ncbi:MAG TPA: HAD family hydrolase [Blastocatellia bacterium]|nr:HAD family hydrolase [Blastocatellia bacterium]